MSLVPGSTAVAQTIPEVASGAAATALQTSPFLIDDAASLALSFPQVLPGSGLHLRRGSVESMLTVLGEDRVSVFVGSRGLGRDRFPGTEHQAGVTYRAGRVRVGILGGISNRRSEREVVAPPDQSRSEVEEEGERLALLGAGLDGAGWSVDLALGATWKQREWSLREVRSPGSRYIGGGSDGAALPRAALRGIRRFGPIRALVYGTYMERTISEDWRLETGGGESRVDEEVYGHIWSVGLGLDRAVDSRTVVRCAIQHDVTRDPGLQVALGQNGLLTEARFSEIRTTGISLSGEYALAAARWGRPTLLLSVWTRTGMGAQWRKVPGLVSRTTWSQRLTTVRWGLAAEKWGLAARAAFSAQILEFSETLAYLDLSADF